MSDAVRSSADFDTLAEMVLTVQHLLAQLDTLTQQDGAVQRARAHLTLAWSEVVMAALVELEEAG